MTKTILETIIGLEIHVQLKTKSKMFCGCANNPDAEPNTNICPVCTGQPGVMPVANQQAIDWTILAGLALNCKINERAKFDRKNYFYPDLPKGYQISQYDEPFCGEGFLEIKVSGKNKKIRIERIHLEEDAGKLLHSTDGEYSLVDLNRTGTPLMEIVTKPDFRTPEEAKIFLQELQKIVRYLKISEANMEKGQMRCDANISLKLAGDWKLNAKTEIKNMNSFRAVEAALTYEITRQTELWQENDAPKGQSTRLWDDVKKETRQMRTKEGMSDYRYFPEPDLPVFGLDKQKFEEIRRGLPELPEARKQRFITEFGLDAKDATIITGDSSLANYFEEIVSELLEWIKSLEPSRKFEEVEKKKAIKLAANWLTSKLFSLFNEKQTSISDCRITAENFAEFIAILFDGKINSKVGQEVLLEMFNTGADPSNVVEQKGLLQVSDSGELGKIAKIVISENPKPAEDYKKGKINALQFLMGQVMKKTRGKANPKIVAELLRKYLQ